MFTIRTPRAGRLVAVAALVAAGLLASSAGASASGRGSSSAAPTHRGDVDVYYAGSLLDLMDGSIAPHFEKATGYTFQGFSGGSGALVTDIESHLEPNDVFISASTSENQKLEGAAGGDLESWFIRFGQAKLVLAYSPSSPFAQALRTRPWYKVITEPGFRIGRTDPATDPKGALTVRAIEAAEAIYDDSALSSVISSSANEYPETTLVGLVQSGQLDAGFFYTSESTPAKLPTVSLGPIHLGATYTVSVLNDAAHRAAAISFVHYLLSPIGLTLLRRHGISTLKPNVYGARAALPALIERELSRG